MLMISCVITTLTNLFYQDAGWIWAHSLRDSDGWYPQQAVQAEQGGLMMMTMITMTMTCYQWSCWCDHVGREDDDDIFAGASRNATEGETGGSRCNSGLHPKPASSQTGELFCCRKISLVQYSCPTWQSLTLLIGYLHWFLYPNNKEIQLSNVLSPKLMGFIGKHLKMMSVCSKDFFIFFSPVNNRLMSMFWPVNAVKRWKPVRALTNRTALNIHNSQRPQRQESFAHFKTFWQHLIEMFTANFLNEQVMFYC